MPAPMRAACGPRISRRLSPGAQTAVASPPPPSPASIPPCFSALLPPLPAHLGATTRPEERQGEHQRRQAVFEWEQAPAHGERTFRDASHRGENGRSHPHARWCRRAPPDSPMLSSLYAPLFPGEGKSGAKRSPVSSPLATPIPSPQGSAAGGSLFIGVRRREQIHAAVAVPPRPARPVPRPPLRGRGPCEPGVCREGRR